MTPPPGTPVPIMATREAADGQAVFLLPEPTALGTLVYYFGVAAIASSFRSLLAVLVFAVFLCSPISS